MKNYIGISRDHSGSMQGITRPAMADYNDNIAAIKEAALSNDIDTIVSVVKCGAGRPAAVVREAVNSNVSVLKPLTSYVADGNSTPLWDSVGELIDLLSKTPDASDPEVSFVVMAITDGQENSSKKWSADRLAKTIQQLQATDRWSFIFRVPRGYAKALGQRLGVPEGNILEWDQTQRGVEQASTATRAAVSRFYTERATGVKSTGRFFANLVQVPASEIKAALSDVSGDVTYWAVPHDTDIRTFVEGITQHPLIKGASFYQLTKTEDVQDHKAIAVCDRTTSKTYSGHDARTLLGLPLHGQIRLSPGNNGNFDVYVQSTSFNRKLIGGTKLLYWPAMAR